MYILHKMTKVSNKLTFICRSVSIYVVIDLVFFILIDHHIGAFYINMRSIGQNLKTIVSCFVHIIHCDYTLSHKSSTDQAFSLACNDLKLFFFNMFCLFSLQDQILNCSIYCSFLSHEQPFKFPTSDYCFHDDNGHEQIK